MTEKELSDIFAKANEEMLKENFAGKLKEKLEATEALTQLDALTQMTTAYTNTFLFKVLSKALLNDSSTSSTV